MNLKDHRKHAAEICCIQLWLSQTAKRIRCVARNVVPGLGNNAASELLEELDAINASLLQLASNLNPTN